MPDQSYVAFMSVIEEEIAKSGTYDLLCDREAWFSHAECFLIR